MELYRYYKGHQKKGVWHAVAVEEEDVKLHSDNVGFSTVLLVSEEVKPGEAVSSEVKYQGPFYIDIDSASLPKAIKAAQKVLAKLVGNGVPEGVIQIWATGKKGFHFLIDMECFTEARPMPKLGLIYKLMALSLQLPKDETDWTVYSSGKGRMWRLPNKARHDNNKFKVGITVSELREMTPEAYDELTSKPRQLGILAQKTKVSFLSGLFKLCVGKAEQVSLPPPIFVDPELLEILKNALPPCGIMLRDNNEVDHSKGFNAVSLQFAKAVTAFAPSDANELIDEFASKATGDNYDTKKKRKDHCLTGFKIASKNTGYDWSCRSALSVLKTEPCDDCPVAFLRVEQDDAQNSKKKEQQEASDELAEAAQELANPTKKVKVLDEFEVERTAEVIPLPEDAKKKEVDPNYNTEGLIVTDDGYGFMSSQGLFRRVCNFTLRIKKYYMEFIPSLDADRRTAIMAEVYIARQLVGSIVIEDDAWRGKQALISCFFGLSNAGFFGTDDDVQKMKVALMQNIEGTAERVRRVSACGIHRERVGETDVFTYVEPGWSIDQFGHENGYFLAGKGGVSPSLKLVSYPKKDDEELAGLLKKMMRINRPKNISLMFAWQIAGFLKQHLLAITQEFPVLGVNGNRGSGKTSSVSLLANLHGADYSRQPGVLGLPGATPFVVWNTMSSSMTVPRIMDEYNKSKLTEKVYIQFGEYFKMSYDNMAVQRGSLSKNSGHGNTGMGAHIDSYPLSAPIVICSEQDITVPALVQRTVQVSLAPNDLNHENVRDNYFECAKKKLDFRPFAKMMYGSAIHTKVDTVYAWLQENRKKVPLSMGDRPQYCYAVLLTALDFMEQACSAHGLRLKADIEEMRENIVSHLSRDTTQLDQDKNRSEIDMVLDDMAAMAALSEFDGNYRLTNGTHFVVEDDYLYLDGVVCFTKYLGYTSNSARKTPVIDNYVTFRSLLKNEPYCESVTHVKSGFAKGRPALQLSMRRLASKGIQVNCFASEEV